jgi:flagellar FliL protein
MSTNDKVKLDYILYAIIIGLLIVLIIGTITGLANKRNYEPEVLLQQGKAVNLSKPANTDIVSYYEIGNIRIVTPSEEPENEQEGCVLVVNPWLSYAEGDTVFYEEIARKRGVIKGICTTYFSERSKEHLLSITEKKVEQELIELINAQLSLGKVQDVYFTDYIFLE